MIEKIDNMNNPFVTNDLSDEFDEEDDLEGAIFGYECVSCGNVQSESFSCDVCLSFSLDPIYE